MPAPTFQPQRLFRRGVAQALLVVVLAVAPRAMRAEHVEFGTDRDAFTPSTHTVDPDTTLVEISYVYIDNRTGGPTNNYPELLARMGLGERLEARFGVNYGVGSQGIIVTSVEAGEGSIDGTKLYESSLLYGLKVDATRQSGWLPESCVIVEGTTPTYGDQTGSLPVATYVAGWELPWRFRNRGASNWRLDGAIRWSSVEGTPRWFDRWSPSVVLRMPVTERLEVHAEYFGSFTEGLRDELNQPFFSPGFHLVLTEHLEIGYRCGWGITEDAAPFFSDVGCALRW